MPGIIQVKAAENNTTNYVDLVRHDCPSESSIIMDKRVRLAKAILAALERQPLRHEALLKTTMEACGTRHKFSYIHRWLKKHGYIHKEEGDRYAPWTITEKGRTFLKGIK